MNPVILFLDTSDPPHYDLRNHLRSFAQVLIVEDLVEALAYSDDTEVDLVFLIADLSEPIALETFECLKAQFVTFGTPLVLAHPGEDHSGDLREMAFSREAAAFFHIPFPEAEITTRIQQLLTVNNLQRENLMMRAHYRDLEEYKSQLLSVVVHELKNPLNGILGYADLIETEDTEDLKKIKQCADHMLDIIDGLIAVDQVLAGNWQPDLSTVDLTEILMHKQMQFAAKAEKKGQRLIFELEPDVVARLDAKRILEAMSLYITNALKFTPAGKPIIVRLSTNNGWLDFHVQDGGPGLSEEDLNRAFDRFQRLTNQPLPGEVASTVGLTMVKAYVEAHEGEVGAYNHTDGGATFWMRLPIGAY
jgi:signal transduction histidine kinase